MGKTDDDIMNDIRRIESVVAASRPKIIERLTTVMKLAASGYLGHAPTPDDEAIIQQDVEAAWDAVMAAHGVLAREAGSPVATLYALALLIQNIASATDDSVIGTMEAAGGVALMIAEATQGVADRGDIVKH